MKNNIFKILTFVFGGLCIALVVFGIVYDSNFYSGTKKQVKALNEEYETKYNDLLNNYNTLVSEKENVDSELATVKADLETTKENLSTAEANVLTYTDAINAEKQAEEERWNALTEEEKNAETEIENYAEMVSTLCETNEEYANLHTYILENMSNSSMSKSERKEFTNKYKEMLEIEEEYKANLEASENTETANN